MSRLDELLNKRDRVAKWYKARLDRIGGVKPPAVESFTTQMSWFVYVVHFDPGVDRDALAKRLAERGIPARPYFLPIHLQPYMAERFGFRPGDFPNTEDLGRRGLALPFSGIMTEEDVESVCDALHQELGAA
jgi:dTDP-4-amino-4,6-dideoxygalactose transaminase